MCFSATASFVTAAATGAIGLATVVRAEHKAELPLASIPLLFAAQQGTEGLLWLALSEAPEGAAVANLTLGFLVFALVLWPIFAPLSAFLVETETWRRRLIGLLLLLGLGIGGHFLWSIVAGSYSAVIKDGHIVYQSAENTPLALGFLYIAATTFAPLISSRRAVALLGALVLIGLLVAYNAYWEAFASVWCFFAAAASLVILGHFEMARRGRLAESETAT